MCEIDFLLWHDNIWWNPWASLTLGSSMYIYKLLRKKNLSFCMQIKKETHVNFIIYMLLKNQKQTNLEFFPKILGYFWQKKLLSLFRMKSLLVCILVTLATSSPIPQRLTEEDFGRSFDDSDLSRDNKVDIFSGYAKVSPSTTN